MIFHNVLHIAYIHTYLHRYTDTHIHFQFLYLLALRLEEFEDSKLTFQKIFFISLFTGVYNMTLYYLLNSSHWIK